MREACSACRERASSRPALGRVLSNLVKAHILHMSRKTDFFSGAREYGCAEEKAFSSLAHPMPSELLGQSGTRILNTVRCSPDGVHAWAAAQDIKFNVHAHPTLSEVLDELFKGAHVAHAKSTKAPAALDSAKQPVAA